MSTSNLQLIAQRLQASVQRTLHGAKPRHLTSRFQQLLRSDGRTIVVTTVGQRDGMPVTERHVVRATRLGVAGHAWELAHHETAADVTRATAKRELKERRVIAAKQLARVLWQWLKGPTNKRELKERRVVAAKQLARVLCWLVLALGLADLAGCGGEQVVVVDAPMVRLRCGVEPPVCAPGLVVVEGPNECELGCAAAAVAE